MSEDTLYTYFKIDVQGMPIDWDYTIVETIEQAGEQLKFFYIHLDDPSIDAKVIITGIGMTIKEFVEWEENRVLPLRLQAPVVALPECNQPTPSINNQREGEKMLRWVRASERLPGKGIQVFAFEQEAPILRGTLEWSRDDQFVGLWFKTRSDTEKIKEGSMRLLDIFWLEETDAPATLPADMAKLPVNEVCDLSGIPDDQKHDFVDGMVKITAENFLKVFVMLGLKDGIESGVDNQATGDQFILIFKKLKYPAAKAAEAPSLPVKEVKEETFGGKEVSILDLIREKRAVQSQLFKAQQELSSLRTQLSETKRELERQTSLKNSALGTIEDQQRKNASLESRLSEAQKDRDAYKNQAAELRELIVGQAHKSQD